MEVIFRIEMNKIEYDEELSYYNCRVWKMKYNLMGVTSFHEKYDDTESDPFYHFYKDGKLFAIGQGDKIDKKDVGFGGVFVNVDIYYPEHLFKETK